MRTFLIGIVLLLCQQAFCQQLPLYNIYRDHWNVLNPASISSNYLVNELNFTVGTSYRQQWFKLEDSPNTQVVNLEIIPKEYDRVVTGGHIIRDQTGLISQIGLYGHFAYQIEMGRRVSQALVFGLNAGVVQYRAQLDKIAFAEEEIGELRNDKVIYPDFGLGAFYYYDDWFYAGVSIPQTFGLSTEFRNFEDESFDLKRVQHFYAVIGGYINVAWFGMEASFVEPSVWFRYVPNSPLSFDLNARYQITDFYWFGLGSGLGFGEQLTSTLHLETGMNLGETVGILNGQLKIGIGFDIPLANYRPFFGNVIEVNVGYSWY